jgi:hypothetical protein
MDLFKTALLIRLSSVFIFFSNRCHATHATRATHATSCHIMPHHATHTTHATHATSCHSCHSCTYPCMTFSLMSAIGSSSVSLCQKTKDNRSSHYKFLKSQCLPMYERTQGLMDLAHTFSLPIPYLPSCLSYSDHWARGGSGLSPSPNFGLGLFT